MKIDYIDIAMAQKMHEEEVAKKLGFDLNTEDGLKRLNKYLEEERNWDILNARSRLKKKFSGKLIKRSELLIEIENIKNERLKPYIEKINENKEYCKIKTIL